MIKINYFDKINPYGVYVKNIGNIHSPYLKDIAKIGINQYQYYLVLMLYTPEKFFEDLSKETKCENIWETFSNEEKNNISMFDILTSTEDRILDLVNAFSIFISGEIEWDKNTKCFLIDKEVKDKKISVLGYINKENYDTVISVCLQFADIKTEDIPETAPKFKTEKDRIFYEKYQSAKRKFSKTNKKDPRFELQNMISLLCTFHQNLNYSNIFNLTLGQIRDSFMQLIKYRRLSINETNYAVWGGKYDPSIWLDEINEK